MLDVVSQQQHVNGISAMAPSLWNETETLVDSKHPAESRRPEEQRLTTTAGQSQSEYFQVISCV